MKKIILLQLIFLFYFNTGYSQYTANYVGSFNGFNSYGAVPNVSAINPTSAITLEAWVNPSVLLSTTMAVIGKNYPTSYFLGVQTSGRVVFYPKGATPFRSRVTGVIPTNKWTHIAATYDGSITSIYINGTLDTSTTGITGAITTNTDSLYIGADRNSGHPDLFFDGKLDNVRIWSSAKTTQEISDNKFIPLEVYAPTGNYSTLRASFQLDQDVASFSGPGLLFGLSRNITFVNNSNKAVNIMDYNNSLVLNGTTDYFTVGNGTGYGFDPTTDITLEAWIRRDTTGSQPTVQNIVNKSGGSSRYDYALYMYPTGQVIFDINSGTNILISPALNVITSAQWNHIAGTYSSSTGHAVIYVNGDSIAGTTFAGNPAIPNDPDNLYIGGIGATSYAANKFKGQIDGVRIWSVLRSASDIKDNMYKATPTSGGLDFFNFDKYTNAIYSGGARIYTGNQFAGTAHISSSHLNKSAELTSPMLSDAADGYYSPISFSSSYKRFFVPDNTPAGIKDSIFVSSGGVVSNLKVFVLMSHTLIGDMTIILTSPAGTTVTLFNLKGGSANDMMTIFSDAADSVASPGTSVNGPGIGAPFSPAIKPEQPLSALNGQSGTGWWKIRFIDNAGGDIGYVHGWGISIPANNIRTLKLTALIQGFYNSSTNKMVKDTAQVFLRAATSPYNFIDTAKALIDSSGKGNFVFHNIALGSSFYIVVKHRNSVETWSSGGNTFSTDTLYYTFTFDAGLAFGNNQIQVDTSPIAFAIYSGDPTQDGNVDLTDIILVYNDATNFVTGYNVSDVTGDNITDLNDIIITYNNSNNFVKKITP